MNAPRGVIASINRYDYEVVPDPNNPERPIQRVKKITTPYIISNVIEIPTESEGPVRY